jgi:WD40 repeat protein
MGDGSVVRDIAFVSYSHADSVWLDRLMILLKPYVRKQQLVVWADKYIQVGDRWEREISQALARTRVGVVLASQNLAASDFIAEVELPALKQAVDQGHASLFCIPVSSVDPGAFGVKLDAYQWARSPKEPLDLLDEARRNQALTEIGLALVALFEPEDRAGTAPVVVEPAPRREVVPLASSAGAGALHGVPALPPNFVPRTEVLQRLRTALFEQAEQRYGISAASKAGVHGQGGIGKTVLATALVQDPEVRGRFADGIYWVSVGQEPNLISLQQSLLEMATGQRPEVESVNLGTVALREALGKRNCLLVLDDVWQSSHASAFDVVGERGRLLVTTRDREILTGLGAVRLELEVLSREDALQLLARWSGARVEALPAAAAAVAQACGYLPLALSVAGAQVADGTSWQDLLAALQRGEIEFLAHAHQSVFVSLSLSVRALPEDEARRYRELAIFPEDTPIPEHVILRLWGEAGLEPHHGRKLLARLANKALLSVAGDGAERTVRFHDLQRDYLALTAEDVPAIHARLLTAYLRDLPEAGSLPARWSRLPAGERYLWHNLFHHLLGAGQREAIDALVTNVRWLRSAIAALGVSSFLEEIALLVERSPTAASQRIAHALGHEASWLHQDPEALPGLLYNWLRSAGVPAGELASMFEAARPSIRLVHPVRLGEERVFRGHTEGVNACAYSSDGSRILSASWDNTVREWDRATGRELARFEGHASGVTACAYSSDGSRILSASTDKTVREWDRTTRRELVRFEGHAFGVTACAYSSDGSRILSASRDKTVREWDRTTGRELARFEGHASWVTVCAYSSDGSRILSASTDKTVREWDRATGRELARFEGHAAGVTVCAYSSDGSRILSASIDGTVREWDRATGRELTRFEGHAAGVTACMYSSDGSHILSASRDKTVREWDQATGRELTRFEGHAAGVTVCAYSSDGIRILSASGDKTVREWDRGAGREPARFEGHADWVIACAYSSDGSRILSASFDKTVREWDRATGRELARFEGHTDGVTACTYSSDGSRILSASGDKTVREWERATGRELARFEGHADWVAACAYSSDGSRILSASFDKTVREWERATGRELARFEGHALGVNACAYSSDGSRILSASDDKTVREWDRTTGRKVARFEGHAAGVSACAYSSDGSRILSASDDKTVREWDRTTGRELARFEGHADLVTACAYSTDGSRILSASGDCTVRIWCRATAQCLCTLHGVAAYSCIATVPGQLVAGDEAGNLWILDCDWV